MPGVSRPAWWWLTASVALLFTAAMPGCGAARPLTPAPTTALLHTSTAPRPAARAPRRTEWLGLNYNSSTGIGALEQFSRDGVVYDRDGPLQAPAGETATASSRLGQGLRVSVASGMDPDVVIDPTRSTTGCEEDPNVSTLCIPTRRIDVSSFVAGFVKTARSIRRNFPRHRIVLEPMNEPWNWGAPAGTQSGRLAASEYAAVLARLLPAVRAAGIPLDDILVQATQTLADGTRWISDLYAAQPCLGPGPGTCGPIEGWSLHPYGLPGSSQVGIDSVPQSRAEMKSGARNVFVTEIGFCSFDAYGGRNCDENANNIDGDAAETARWLGQTLRAALVMHRQGWLKALIVWDRGGDAWGMENPNGSLTASGRVLVTFAKRDSPHPQ